jgi:3-isopropylmalate dehydrogenase
MRVVCLPGDGIGPEVMAEAVRVLRVLAPDVRLDEHAIGAGAMRDLGESLPATTLAACRSADAVLMGAVGLADQISSDDNPEQGMFALRKALDVYANLRPFRADGIDMLIVRELVGGLYFGASGTRDDGVVYDTCEYHPAQVERIVRRGFEFARERGRRLTSVDKANVLATSRMWRKVTNRIAMEFPDVEVDHLLVDTAAMQLVRHPGRFDVIVTENTFGDILSDVAAGVCGGLGVAASAALGDHGAGLFEPVHGTADITGQGLANPTAMLLSVALLLRYGLRRPAVAERLEQGVTHARTKAPTRDVGGTASTQQFGDCVLAWFAESKSDPIVG